MAKKVGSVIVNGFSQVTRNTIIGKNVSFNGMCITGCGEVRIGDNFHSGPGCLLIAQNHNYESDKIPYNEEYICRDITIEANVWLGSRVIVLPGTVIEEGVIVQAGSVVSGRIATCSIIGGNPARVFKHRDRVRYNSLKEKKAFF